MKSTIVAVLIFFCSECIGQKIKSSELDKFENERRIETSGGVLGMGLDSRFKIRSIGADIFLKFISNGSFTVGTQDPLIFLLNNKSQIRLFPTEIQSSYYTGALHVADFQYRVSAEQLDSLSKNTIVTLRWYASDSYQDVEVSEKHAKKISKLCTVFLEEYFKHNK